MMLRVTFAKACNDPNYGVAGQRAARVARRHYRKCRQHWRIDVASSRTSARNVFVREFELGCLMLKSHQDGAS